MSALSSIYSLVKFKNILIPMRDGVRFGRASMRGLSNLSPLQAGFGC